METRISVTATDTPAVIALPSSVAIPSTSSFDLYSNSSKNHFLHASDPTIDWQGHELPNESCSYAVAIHNKRTGKMQLVPADLFMTRPLPHRQLTNTSVPIEDAASDRRDLGTTFGTRKAIRNIRAAERDKVDTSSTHLHSIQSSLQKGIAETTDYLDEVPVQAASNDLELLLPPHDFTSTSVETVYPLEKLASAPEILVLQQATQEDPEALMNDLPVRESAFIDMEYEKIKYLKPSVKKEKAVAMFLLSVHLAFRKQRGLDRNRLCEQFPFVPVQVVDGMLDRFTVPPRQGQSRKMTENDHSKMMFYMLALMLHISGFQLNIPIVAKECQLGASKVRQYLKMMGCSFTSAAESEGHTKDQATLKIPLPFTSTKDIRTQKYTRRQ